MILTISRYLLCGVVIQIALGAPHSDRSSLEFSILPDDNETSIEIYTYNHEVCDDMEKPEPIIVSVSMVHNC